uniref:ABC transporter permease subunit n=1 Tax=Litorimonas sp. TaxID=1892381 RepID=UPI003A877E5B
MELANAFLIFANFVLVPSITYGAQLALGALGVTLIFGVLRFSNFSHGEMMSFGTMVTILVTWVFQKSSISIYPLPTALLA